MNVIDTQALSHQAPGRVRWAAVAAAPVGGGFHNIGEILLALLVLGGLGFGVMRLRRGRHAAPHDDQRIRREPPPEPPPQPSPSQPPGRTAISQARTPRAAGPSRAPGRGWGGPTPRPPERLLAHLAAGRLGIAG